MSCSGLDVKETGGSWRPDKPSNAVDRASKMRGVSRGRAPVPSSMRHLESGTSFNTRAGVRAVRFRLAALKAGRPFRDRVSVMCSGVRVPKLDGSTPDSAGCNTITMQAKAG